MATRAISVTVEDRPGMLFKTTQVLTENAADIRYVDILHRPANTEIFFECEMPGNADAIGPVIERLRRIDGAEATLLTPSTRRRRSMTGPIASAFPGNSHSKKISVFAGRCKMST